MRIVQASPFYDPHAGGVEAYVRRVTEELVRRGHELTVLTSRYDRALPETEARAGYRIVRSRTLGVVLDTPIDVGATRSIRALEADVVHLHYPPPLTSYFATRGLRGRRTPVVLTY
ncbi:MAG TPA: glycosyltransferase, partial [Thermoplasmata archaeon]|nr:glycosyltransferase [Thermoplasmata archaeon]